MQFDPVDGHENLFKHVDQDRLRSFGWHPITHVLASKIKHMVVRVSDPPFPAYRVVLGPGRKLIAHRQEAIRHTSGKVGEDRWTKYFLGYEQEGQRHIIRIDEGGNVESG